jgi:formate dehydrogenase major subunit
VAGVADTLDYGAMTNSINDMRHAKSFIFIGSNAPEAHPVSMQHILHAKEKNNAPIIVVDPRRTKLAAKATDYVTIRPGTDTAFIMGLVNAVIANGWADKEFVGTRASGFEAMAEMAGGAEMAEAAKSFTPEVVENITGIPAGDIVRIAKILADNRPTSLICSSGRIRHYIGRSINRGFRILQLVLGNMGKSGGGINIFRGHDNAQGAMDMCVLADSLPAYSGLADDSWQHWCRVWDVDCDWIAGRFKEKDWMNKKGLTPARRYEELLQGKKDHQFTPLKALIQWGGGSEAMFRHCKVKQADDLLELLVVIDPFPTMAAAVCETDNVYLLPSSGQYETSGSVTSSSRQLQWRNKVVDPVHNSKDDYQIMELLVKKLGFAELFYKNIKQVPEDITRELGRGALTIGYNGQTPERIKRHMENWHTFDRDDLQAKGGPCDGEYYGLPWPCWTENHPGTPILRDVSKPVAEGDCCLETVSNCWGNEEICDAESRVADQPVATNAVYTSTLGSEFQGEYSDFMDTVPGTDWISELPRKVIKDAMKDEIVRGI